MKLHPMDRCVEQDMGFVTPCWLWMGAKNSKGYGMLKWKGRVFRSHRWFYEHFVGPIPAGLQLDHLCRQRDCVNPRHLEPVTCAENIGRGKHGALSAAEVLEIRRRLRVCHYGEQKRIAAEFGISPVTVSQIKLGKVYRRV